MSVSQSLLAGCAIFFLLSGCGDETPRSQHHDATHTLSESVAGATVYALADGCAYLSGIDDLWYVCGAHAQRVPTGEHVAGLDINAMADGTAIGLDPGKGKAYRLNGAHVTEIVEGEATPERTASKEGFAFAIAQAAIRKSQNKDEGDYRDYEEQRDPY